MHKLYGLISLILTAMMLPATGIAQSAFGTDITDWEQKAAYIPPPMPKSAKTVSQFYSILDKNTPKKVKTVRRAHRNRKAKVSVNLREIPSQKLASGEHQLMCGAKHVRRHRSPFYMNPTSACMLMGAAQEWRQKFCPDNSPDCQLLIGDASFGHNLKSNPSRGSWPHGTHRRGLCVDIYPIRSIKQTKEVTYKQKDYDYQGTKNLLKVLHRWGSDKPHSKYGNQVFFNDRRMVKSGLSRVLKGEQRNGGTHDGHIHICFRDNKANRKRCNKTKFNTQLCPSMSNNPTTAASEIRRPEPVTQPESRGTTAFGVEI